MELGLTKKQVRALLKILKSECSDGAWIEKYKDSYYLTATDNFILASIKMDADFSQIKEFNEGAVRVKREELERWYKLASAKDTFIFLTDMLSMLSKPEQQVPRWRDMDQLNSKVEGVTEVRIQAEFLQILEQLDGNHLTMTFTGNNSVIHCKSNRNKENTYLLMPMKIYNKE